MKHSSFDSLASQLEEVGIKKSNMFGMPVLKLGKKPICGLESDGINFKLPVDSPKYDEALGLEGAHLFQPIMKSGKTMTMKQWIVVPFAFEELYFSFAEASIRFVEADVAGN